MGIHKKKFIICAGVLLCILLIAVWAVLRQRGTVQRHAVVTFHDEVIMELDLDNVSDTSVFTVGEPGSQNTIQISPDGIGVISADCPDQICVNQGIRAHGPEPIVCLPHRLIITFTDNGDDDLDAVIGR